MVEEREQRLDDVFQNSKNFLLFCYMLLAICAFILTGFALACLLIHNWGIDALQSLNRVGGSAIIAGVGMFLIIVFGIIAVIRENSFMLTICSFVLIILLLLFVYLSSFTLANSQYENSIKDGIVIEINKIFAKYSVENEQYMQLMDNIQTERRCCGVHGPDDWIMKNITIPISCCEQNNCVDDSHRYKKGCAKVIASVVIKNYKAIGGLAAIFAILLLFSATFTNVIIFIIQLKLRRKRDELHQRSIGHLRTSFRL